MARLLAGARDLIEDADADDDSTDAPQGQQLTATSSLPALLPDEILAEEPSIRLPTPPPAATKSGKVSSKKHRFFEAPEEKRPKDVMRGSIRVRVLEKTQLQLPPKVGKSGQLVKERWLVGRSGAGGVGGFERRPTRGGFLRR